MGIPESEFRLELLKLTYTHARGAAEAVERAEILQAYIVGGSANDPKVTGTRSRKPGRKTTG